MSRVRPLGWNEELLGAEAWEFLQRHLAGRSDCFVGGESALAGFWLHHRLVRHLEVVVPDQATLDAMRARLDEEPQQVLPGFARYPLADLTVDHAVVLDPDKPEQDGVRADSLRDLAADRLLRLATGANPGLLADLYFLDRARVDLLAACHDAASKDLGLTPSALAVVLAHAPRALPDGMLRPVDPEAFQAFLEELVLRFGMNVRT